MDTTKINSKSTVGTVTADNFSDLLENGYIANIMRDNPRAHDAWRDHINLADRLEPAMHEIRIPGTPEVHAVDADLAAGIIAVAHAAAIPDFYRFEHTAGGNLSAAGNTAFRAALEKHDSSLEKDRFLNAQTMQNLYSSYSSDLQRLVRDSDPAAFDNCLQSYSLWTFTELTRQALTAINLNSANKSKALATVPPDTDTAGQQDHLPLGDAFSMACIHALSSSIGSAPCYWDNASSVNLTGTLSLLEQVHLLKKPFNLGGPSAQMIVTHIGIFPCLPAGKNVGYYSSASNVTLFSIGNWCANEGETHQTKSGLKVYDTSGPNPILFDSCPPLDNNLSPISESIFTPRRSGTDVPCTRWDDVFSNDYKTLSSTVLLNEELAAYHSAADPLLHYTAEQIKRANAVDELHYVYAHINDHDLGTMLDTGLIQTPLRLTSRDVAINRTLRLNCPQCLEGKMRMPHYGASTNTPAERIGESLQLDAEQNPVPAAAGGATHSIMIIDDASGEIGVVPATDKTGPSILHATLKYINSHYRAHGHATLRLSADAESVFKSMIPLFGKAGYVLTLMAPQQHAQRLERYQQALLNRMVATLASVDFYFPLRFQSQLRSAVAFTMSLQPNSLTSPSSPYVLRTGMRHAQHPLADKLHIGTTCMVLCGQPSRVTTGRSNNQTVKTTPRSELGVCLGHSQETPGAYNFILENGQIVPRKILSIVQVTPWDWKRRTVIRTYIKSPPVTPSALPRQPLPPAPVVFPPSVTGTLSANPPGPAGTPLGSTLLDPSPRLPSTDAPSDSLLDAEYDSPVVRILSHTGDLSNLDSCEFHVEYQDGTPGYDWAINLKGCDPFKEYLLLHKVPRALVPRKPSPSTLRPQGSRSSPRLAAPVPITDADGWTLVTSGPPGTFAARSLRSPLLPSSLETLFEDDGADLDDALTVMPPATTHSSFDDTSDLDWYSPPTSTIPSATATIDLPWSLEQEPPPASGDLTYAQALKLHRADTIAATAKEMAKYFDLYDVCRRSEEIAFKDIPPHALKQQNRIFFKQKFRADGSHDKFSGRCYTDGSRQPANTYFNTYAAVSDTTDTLATLAAYTARANALKRKLSVFHFDITAFFLQNSLTPANSPVDCYIRMPPDIPHFSAGKWYPRHATTYGSKDANHIADTNLHALFATAGFFPNPEAPRTYSKFDPSDPTISCTVNMHVDDGNGCSFSDQFTADLRSALEARYGPLTWSSDASSHCGLNLQRYTDGSLSVDQSGHIARMLKDLGAEHLPYVAKPSLDDFFDAPTNLTPVSKKYYQHVLGNVVYCMISKTNLRKEIQYLSTRQANPVQSDIDKIIRLLAYLLHHQDEKIRFSGSDFQVHLWCDASYGSHPDGRSHDGYFITVGENNGAICSHSSKQTHCVAQGSMEAEYVALTPGVKRALHFRRFLHGMGFKQTGPIIIHEDNKSAINLAHSPQIPRNSQHIHVRYHFIRDLVAANIVKFVYTTTDNMIADLLTKTLPLGTMQRFTRLILNEASTPLVTLQAGSNSSA